MRRRWKKAVCFFSNSFRNPSQVSCIPKKLPWSVPLYGTLFYAWNFLQFSIQLWLPAWSTSLNLYFPWLRAQFLFLYNYEACAENLSYGYYFQHVGGERNYLHPFGHGGVRSFLQVGALSKVGGNRRAQRKVENHRWWCWATGKEEQKQTIRPGEAQQGGAAVWLWQGRENNMGAPRGKQQWVF